MWDIVYIIMIDTLIEIKLINTIMKLVGLKAAKLKNDRSYFTKDIERK